MFGILSFILARNFRIVFNYHLVLWSTTTSQTKENNWFSLEMFIWFSIGSIIFIVLGNILFFLFNLLLSKSLFERMSFGVSGGLFGKYYYKTPMSHYIDLFKDDLSSVDNQMPFNL